jgi:hypothetical protein
MTMVGLAQERGGDVGGRAPEHVCEQEHALARVHALDRPLDLLARHVHVVVPADGDRRDVVYLFHDHLRRGNEFVGQLPVRHYDSAYHTLL